MACFVPTSAPDRSRLFQHWLRRLLSSFWLLGWGALIWTAPGWTGLASAHPIAQLAPEPSPTATSESSDPEPEISPSPQPPQRLGSFRVGNRTPYPVRLVILLRSGERVLTPERAHWDFAPGEGGNEGLLLSLGTEPLQISPGDVVIAFTIDGTRQYWGPNVVGESLSPFWDPQQQVWSMILQP